MTEATAKMSCPPEMSLSLRLKRDKKVTETALILVDGRGYHFRDEGDLPVMVEGL
jgi:hypothetical protein